MNENKTLFRVYKKYQERYSTIKIEKLEINTKILSLNLKKIRLNADREFSFILGTVFILGGGIPFSFWSYYKSYQYHKKINKIDYLIKKCNK